MNNAIVISLFDKTGIMVEPWLQNGYHCIIVDIQHKSGITIEDSGLIKIGTDLSKPLYIPELNLDNIVFIAAFPPCTHLAVSGARWFKGKGLRALANSINLFANASEFCESTEAAYMIENPVSTISTYWRKPDYTFHPYMFTGFSKSDNYTKKTCLWTGNGFTMPKEYKDESLGKPDNRIHFASPGKDRADLRSATPLGFAKAVYEANKI